MLKPSLQLRLGQQLTMTPQLQQAIRLLQLPVMELQAQIREALETNVMLEAEDEPSLQEESLEEAEPTFEMSDRIPEPAVSSAVEEQLPEVADESEWQDS